ncbi:MAG: amidohydrolase family protein [Sphingomonas fennica]
MTVEVLDRETQASVSAGVIDCDIHPAPKGPMGVLPFLPEKWQEHARRFGNNYRQPFTGGMPYPRFGDGNRMDARLPDGSYGGTDLAFMQRQHLDANDIVYGILQPLAPNAQSQRHLDYAAALAGAVNDWQREAWCVPDNRLKASLVVPQEDPEASAREIGKRAGDRHFVQVAMAPRGIEPLGRRRYWPIYEAAVAAGLPIGLHVGGFAGAPPSGSGWVSYYLEDHHSNTESMQALVTSLVLEGTFDRFPDLKIVLIEGGFVWLPALTWRLDKHFETMRGEVSHLKRRPSDYIKDHFWFTTQPIDEPQKPLHMRETIDWIGWDKILFSTDYPHWDYDDPKTALARIKMNAAEKRMIFRDNAARLYGLD